MSKTSVLTYEADGVPMLEFMLDLVAETLGPVT